MIKKLDNSSVQREHHPVKILQFGEGNFLRAFVDWQLDIANEKGVIDAGVAVVEPRFGDSFVVETLRNQDFLYHVLLEGIEDGKPKKETRLIKVIEDAFSPGKDYPHYLEYICSPELRVIISNTTEAGIRYEKDDVLSEHPATFPGKVTGLLYKRWKHFGGDPEKGLYFICCELIEDNATTLRKYILRHAEEAGLEKEFIQWIDDACIFCDSLVDRIVPGFPRDTINEIKEELGFDDNLVVKGELYHLWAIGGKGYEKVREVLPLDEAGLHVLFMPSIKAFRDKKVRILNGSHTGMVPVALQMGCETVMDAFNNPDINRFINTMVEREVLPMIDEDPEELKAFAAGILERFYNPYIKHLLKSISLNSLSKWEARNFDTVRDNWEKAGKIADAECFTFAALLSLYSPFSGFEPDDNAAHIAYIRDNWNDADLEATVSSIVSKSGIFVLDFAEIVPGFVGKVAEYLGDIRTLGMKDALAKFLAAHE